ncbi:argininosuccinate lyase [Tetragenococcus halophilus]|uniref:Argininosuccinate lyase n=1 Tax=Tetragenococcus halophilus (strain DSM 20338 / JCM 20259 / NCIMB 9735 / NBRC 12172) TaxID=945021 RepID=A0AAN1SGG4_TETHN|nr:argininosuccinate lyase [Tetragenococcus halophilus]QXN85984.1 argininosuccinate lyase [Tetragenococcus halophilus]WJS81059.1 argininosuccinate lyase [Tetragenococcus halophilus]BAK94575.1 argininosuccinate lyase [Tetragenococcus halophilus NBRC 12172]GBD61642.1 argininosuccinate lyase [Tetragenococcus halophilus subsp. halophilus]GBD70832.1 argininosuccinate lyase [Tetragenococcus halophilus subsp. halophilus]
MKKLWGGRFTGENKDWVDTFGASISFDYQLAKEDILGSLAHVKMLGACAIITKDEMQQIQTGLENLQEKLANDELTFTIQNEDIHLNIESLLTEEIGPVAGKLHTARSRNDQVATDMHLYLKETVILVIKKLHQLRSVLLGKAEENVETIMPGYTHMQHAQPISFGHHLLAYYQMLTRDQERMQESLSRIDISPLGAAALAGTTFPIDRQMTADELGFSDIYDNSLDAVSDRDFILEFLSNASLLMMHLSRFCEELILWCTYEFQFVELTDTFSTGSSIMPQKKNPDMAELIRGKTGRVYGNLTQLLTVMKGLPLAYNKDFQEDKEGMFDASETVITSLEIMSDMIKTMKVNPTNMQQATEKDFSNATELADYLANKGIPFRQAHEIVGKLVLECIQQGSYLQDIPLKKYQEVSPVIEADIYDKLSAATAVKSRNSTGGTGFDQVKAQIEKARKELQN